MPRVYRNGHEKSPTVVFFHGGGWVAGDLETHDRQARLLVIETGAVVISVDYRRPPETRFPGAFEDAFAATQRYRRPPRRVRRRYQAHRRGRRQRRRQSAATTWRSPAASRKKTRRAIAGLSRDRWAAIMPTQGKRALSLAPRKRRRLFPVARGDGMVRRPLSRRQIRRHGLAGFAAACQQPRGTGAGRRHHRMVRSAARRGQGLCRCAFGCRRPDQILLWRRTYPRLFLVSAMPRRRRAREAKRARADFKTLLERGT